jgi:ATP-binding cassette subfamily F protein 3
VFVSHDRAFIDRLANRVIDLREGRAVLLSGNYSDTANARAERRRRPEPERGQGESTAGALPAVAASRPAAGKPAPRPGKRAESPEDREAARKRRRIKTLEDKIALLEAQVEALETRLWDEALTLGPVAAHELSKQKSAKKAELDALVEQWARLSEEAESPASRPS